MINRLQKVQYTHTFRDFSENHLKIAQIAVFSIGNPIQILLKIQRFMDFFENHEVTKSLKRRVLHVGATFGDRVWVLYDHTEEF